jgi:hypothetical protein
MLKSGKSCDLHGHRLRFSREDVLEVQDFGIDAQQHRNLALDIQLHLLVSRIISSHAYAFVLIAGAIEGVKGDLYLSELAGLNEGVADQRRRTPSGTPHVVNPEELVTCILELKRVRNEFALQCFTPVVCQLLKLYSGTGKGGAGRYDEKRRCEDKSDLKPKKSVPSHKCTS